MLYVNGNEFPAAGCAFTQPSIENGAPGSIIPDGLLLTPNDTVPLLTVAHRSAGLLPVKLASSLSVIRKRWHTRDVVSLFQGTSAGPQTVNVPFALMLSVPALPGTMTYGALHVSSLLILRSTRYSTSWFIPR